MTTVLNLRAYRVKRFIQQVTRRSTEVKAESGKGLVVQLREMARFYRELGTSEDEYYDHRLFDPALTAADAAQFLSIKRWWEVHTVFNPAREHGKVTDKDRFQRALEEAGIPVVPTLGTMDVANRSVEDLTQALRAILPRIPAAGFVIKPCSGSEGRNILVFEGPPDPTTQRARHVTGELYGLDDIARVMLTPFHDAKYAVTHRYQSYLAQPRLVAHPDLRAFASHTLSTVRIVTLLDPEGHCRILAASFKMPVRDVGVDNYSAGSLAVAVDPETGVLERGTRLGHPGWLTSHPITGQRFTGTTLPLWRETCRMIEQAARVFPTLRCLGWDVAITAAGPVPIEAGPFWGINLVQVPQRRGIWRPPMSTAFDHYASHGSGSTLAASHDSADSTGVRNS